jgi:hypothetical protein
MTEIEFWTLIAQSYSNAGSDFDRQLLELKSLLEELPSDQIVTFDTHFERHMRLAYSWDVWAAACIVGGGCSDDAFIDFRGTLIAFGKEVFESVVDCSDTLRDVLNRICFDDPEDELFVEGFCSVAGNAHLSSFGEPLPKTDLPALEISGAPWDDRTDDLAARCPRLWNRYGPEDESQNRLLTQARDCFGKRQFRKALVLCQSKILG